MPTRIDFEDAATVRSRRMTRLLAIVAFALLATPAVAAPEGSTVLVDRPTGFGPLPGDGMSGADVGRDSVSATGRYVAFSAQNDALLPPGADRGLTHVFVRDRLTSTTTMADVSLGGAVANAGARDPAISADGNRVAWVSSADNLTADAPPFGSHVYVKDLTTGVVTLASRATGAAGAIAGGFNANDPVLDGDGSVVAFATYAQLAAGTDVNFASDVYTRDLATGTTTLVSRDSGVDGATSNQDAERPAIDGDGSVVVFDTREGYAAGDTNGDLDVYARAGNATVLVSRRDGAGTTPGNGQSYGGSVTTAGDRVAFQSGSTNLTAEVVSNSAIYVRDSATDTTVLASRPTGTATLADGHAGDADISGDGTRVSFGSSATNLGAGQPTPQMYVRTLATDTTADVSQAQTGNGRLLVGGLSGDGTVATFATGASNLGYDAADGRQVFARGPGGVGVVSGPTGATAPPAEATDAVLFGISASGRHVLFGSEADPLAGDDTDGVAGVFLRDLADGTTESVLKGPGGVAADAGTESAALSADGDVVAFQSIATNLVGSPPDEGVYVRDRAAGTTELVSRPAGVARLESISADGNRVAFSTAEGLDPLDTNGDSDVYVHDRTTDATVLASRPTGAGTAPSAFGSFGAVLDADGSRVAFVTNADDLGDGDGGNGYDVHLRDLATNETIFVSRRDGAAGEADGSSGDPSISDDGTRVAFSSSATDMSPGATAAVEHVHVRDLAAGTTRLVSRIGVSGDQANGEAVQPFISGDGTRVGYVTAAGNMVAGDRPQVLVRELATGATTVASRADGAAGALAGAGAGGVVLNADGGCAAFTTAATGLAPDGYPSPDFEHVFLRAVSGACPRVPDVPPVVTATPTATATVAPTATATPYAIPRDTTAPRITKVRPARKRVRFTLSEGARVRVTLTRRGKRVKRFRVEAQQGVNRVKWRGRKLRPGRHRVVLKATDGAGNASSAAKRFRVKRR